MLTLVYRAYLDCHLMVTNPLDYVEPLGKAGASGFTFHVEVSKGAYKMLEFPLLSFTVVLAFAVIHFVNM